MARLDSICKLNMGQSPDSASYNEDGRGVPFFQGNADFGAIHPSVRVWCDAPTKIAHAGDILISVRAPIGALNIANRDCCIGRGLAALTVDESVCNKKYLWHCISSKVDELNAKGTGSTFKAISKNVLAETEIVLPSIEQQVKIANELELISNMLSLRKQQLAKLDELVKSRFIELFDNGESPIKTVEELCSAIVDCPHTTPKYEGELKNPTIRTSEIKKGYITWETMRYVSDEEYEERTARLKPEAGDIVYGREGTVGNAAVLPKGYNFCLGQRVMLLRPDYSKCTSEYLLHAVISDDVYRQALEKNNASTVAHVNVKDVKQFKVPLPSFDKQKQFAALVEQVDKSKFEIQKSLEKLETLKKALMQKYFG